MNELSTPTQTPPANLPAAKATAYPYGPQPATIPKYSPNELDWPSLMAQRPQIPLAAVYIACLGFNFLMPLLISAFGREPVLLIALAFGVFATELAGLCAVLVFGEWKFWKRLAAVWALGYSLGLVFLLGIFLSEPHLPDRGKVVVAMFCALPLVALAAQLPLWAARHYFGWQVRRPGSPGDNRPLSIGDILIGTAVAAATVGLVRFVPAGPQGPDLNFWIGWAVAVTSIAAVSLVAVLPAMYVVLRLGYQAVGCLVLVGYALAAAAATLIVISSFSRRGPDEEILVLFPVMFVTFALVLFGLLRLAHARGYRLVFAGERLVRESPTAA